MGKRKAPSSSRKENSKHKKTRNSKSDLENTDRMSIPQLVQKVQQTFAKHADPQTAVKMKKYMRDQFEYFGIKSPLRRSLSKTFLGLRFNNSEIRELVKSLWKLPQRELQNFGLDFLDKNLKMFEDPAEELEANWEFLELLIVNKSWWDTVDMVATHSVGCLVKKHQEEGKAMMEKWIDHDNMWLRRTALLHQLLYKDETDEDMLYRFCIARAHEKEFFIQKAMGWALRQHAYTQQTSVKKFLKTNKTLLSKLTYREAAKHLQM